MSHPPTISRRTACAALASAGAAAILPGYAGAPRARSSALQSFPVPSGDDRRWSGRAMTVSAWGGEVQQAIREVIWDPFAESTGCTIHELPADLTRLRASVDAGDPYTDLILVSGIWAETDRGKSLTSPFLANRLADRHFVPFPTSERSAPAFTYALVNTFHREFEARYGAPASWPEWWDQTAFPGTRSLPRSPLGSFEFSLLADGVEPSELYPLDQERALESLSRVRETISSRWWTDGFEPVGWLSSGAASLAAVWHYRTIAGQQDGRPVDFGWQSGLLVADVWVSPVGSANADVAADLVEFATSPAVQAELATTIPLGPVVPGAFDAIEERRAVWMPTYQPNLERLILYDPSWWGQHVAETTRRFDCWLGLGDC